MRFISFLPSLAAPRGPNARAREKKAVLIDALRLKIGDDGERFVPNNP
jgi:hypothetical protein